ncbi:MAG: CarD family transcriptional regulator [Bacteriovoracales bacterium]|nr:CarD family transcriptional regulator [Bacteriovoracales bacterium]
MFEPGEYVVCPGDGVGQLLNIEERDLGGQLKSFYSVKIIENGMKMMIPTDSKDGIRPLVSKEEVGEVFDLLSDHDVEPDTSTWNRRYREYVDKIKTGSLLEIADVLRSLLLLKHTKTLSFSEKKILDQCKALLVEEIALSQGRSTNQVDSTIESYFAS